MRVSERFRDSVAKLCAQKSDIQGAIEGADIISIKLIQRFSDLPKKKVWHTQVIFSKLASVGGEGV